jgi:hypothetical protein
MPVETALLLYLRVESTVPISARPYDAAGCGPDRHAFDSGRVADDPGSQVGGSH